MKNVFRGELYVGDDKTAFTADICLECGKIRFVKDKGGCVEADLSALKFAIGGFENTQLEVSAITNALQQIVCYVAPNDKNEFLKRCLVCGHGINKANVESVIRAQSKSKLAFYAPLCALLSAILIFISAFFVSSKSFSAQIIKYIPVEYEAQIGKLSAKKLIEGKRLITSGPLYEAVNAVLTRVLGGVKNNPYKFKLYLVCDSTINAMAAPGGHVVVFTGLLNNIESAEELAGILAHECAHVMHRHSLRAILNNTLTIGMAAALLSGVGADRVIVELAASSLQNAHSRDDEREADASGVKFLINAHINPAPFLNFFDRIEKKGNAFDGALAILSTHPSSKERSARLKALIAAETENNAPYPNLTPAWNEIKPLIPPPH